MATIKSSDCPHIASTSAPSIDEGNCAVCGVSRPTRVCLTCGHVGCCESSAGHALAHSKASGHPLIRELPISERSFTWCYGCNAYLSG
jgi:uncharacterized UBP type Zn finger protein